MSLLYTICTWMIVAGFIGAAATAETARLAVISLLLAAVNYLVLS